MPTTSIHTVGTQKSDSKTEMFGAKRLRGMITSVQRIREGFLKVATMGLNHLLWRNDDQLQDFWFFDCVCF